MLDRHPLANPVTGLIPEVTNLEATPAGVAHDSDGESHKDIETGSTEKGQEKQSTEALQDGVRQAEAITATWSKNSLRTAYAL